MDANVEHSLLHDLKEMVIDIKDLKANYQVLEERMNILLLENAKLKLILDDVYQSSIIIKNKPINCS